MNILLSILITVAFGLGFYFYMVHGEGKLMMLAGIIGIIVL